MSFEDAVDDFDLEDGDYQDDSMLTLGDDDPLDSATLDAPFAPSGGNVHPGAYKKQPKRTANKKQKTQKAQADKNLANTALPPQPKAPVKKRKNQDMTSFASSDPNEPFPLNMKLYTKHGGRWHPVKILEKKEKTPEEKAADLRKKQERLRNRETDPPLEHILHPWKYYIHYVEWDRRMDEWVTRDKLMLEKNLIDMLRKELEEKQKMGKLDADNDPIPSVITEDVIMKQISGSNIDDEHHGGHGNFTEEDIRAHEEATKVKNIDRIILGKYQVSTWYFSPFPEWYDKFDTLYFCEFCLNFFGYEVELERHSRKCTLRHPPGNEIYRSEEKNINVAVYEVDGAKERVYCQNICYLAKLFLDHKTLEYDCTPFLFYIFCEVDQAGAHILGYFSKEKISMQRYNLACILTLPCHQRKGVGKLIISLSYELSKIEEKVGSPEKPISDLGKVSYLSYWSSTLLKILKDRKWNDPKIEDILPPTSTNLTSSASAPSVATDRPRRQQTSIEDLSKMTCITTEDIIETLRFLKILIWYKGKWCFSETQLQIVLQERAEAAAKAATKVVDPNAVFVGPCRAEKLHWTPFFVNKRSRTGP